MLARRGCPDFVLFLSLNKALLSCGLLHKPCLLLHPWCAHAAVLWTSFTDFTGTI